MTKSRKRRDPMDLMIEDPFQPGDFISYYDDYSFVEDLRGLEAKIVELTGSDPTRAVTLYETLLAGCNAKAEEIDDSDGEFGMFAGSLYCGWIKARQATDVDRGETARLLLRWMDDDSYGFCNDLELSAVKVFDRAGLEAFESEVRARFDKECAALSERKPASPNPNYARDHWCRMLKAVYSQRRNVGKYIELTMQNGLTPRDCEVIATMFQARRRLDDALTWVERGLAMEKPNAFGRGGYKLDEIRRTLLVKLGRGGDALDSAWAEFRKEPGKFTYEELVRYVPKAQRRAWHEKAMDAAAEHSDLDSVIELWLGAKEIGRLAERLERTGHKKLESLSHYVTEPAAERLVKTHPGIAAKLFRAMCMRVVNAGKSQYYHAALSNIEKAKNSYQRAGLNAQWQALIAEIRREHRRKSSFMPGFERIVGGTGPGREPSFLDRARRNWGSRVSRTRA